MPERCQDLLHQTLLLDIEVNEKNEIYSLGAVLGEKTFLVSKNKKINQNTLREFDIFGREARFVLGHNILNHDIPRLQHIAPDLQLFNKPRIDTLFLSPLAYPANPYHRLIKNYQIVCDSINDPVQDAMLAGKIFAEQWDALVQQFEENSDVPLFYRGFLSTEYNLAGILDDLLISPLTHEEQREHLEIVEERYDRKSTIVTSQLPLKAWHAAMQDHTLADAILDRLVHNAYKLELKGESMRRKRSVLDQKAETVKG